MANIIRRSMNPFSLTNDGFDNWFKDFLEETSFGLAPTRIETQRSFVRRDDDKLTLELDIPGVKKEDIRVFLQEGRLNVSWSRKGQNYSHTEYVGDVIDPEAKVEDGILTVTMKIPQAQRVDVEIK